MSVESDEAAIRAVIERCGDAWNAGDGAAFGSAFAEDADYVVVNGQHIRGRAAIDAGHQQIFDTIYAGSTNDITVERVRFLRPDVAIAHVLAHLRLRPQPGEPPREARARSTWVLVKEGDGWTTSAFHNTPIAEEPQR